MIDFKQHTLVNGLRVIVHEDFNTPLVAVNLLYEVGSKHEDPEKTGFAHLFEHLMFSGSENIPNFDDVIQQSGGENNAFTNSDITNFYELLPAENIETALWLESDRMRRLNINKKSFDIQKKVVVEEFKETCLNAPYGDAWHHISELAYSVHPYKWPTIGKDPTHIEDAVLSDAEDFYSRHYTPDNAILVLAGNIKFSDAIELVQKWFGDIVKSKRKQAALDIEPVQNEFKFKRVHQNVPFLSIYMSFHMPNRSDPTYYICDIISDILANGRSSRFFQKLYKQSKLFSSIDAYITGYADNGLFMIEAKLKDAKDEDLAKSLIWKEIELLKESLVADQELKKLKNKLESSLKFSEVNILNKAINLAYYTHIGDTALINKQAEIYGNITATDIKDCAKQIFRKENCSELTYEPTAQSVAI